MVMGNQEEFFIAYHDPNDVSDLKTAVRLRPMHFFAHQMPASKVAEMKSLPLTLTIPGPQGQDIMACHASPMHTRRSFAAGIDEAMDRELIQVNAAVIAAGHLHIRWHQR